MSELEPELLQETDVASLVPMTLDEEPEDYAELENDEAEEVKYEDADTSGDPVTDSDEETEQ